MIRKIIRAHHSCWRDRNFLVSVITSGVFFIASLFLNYAAGTYATRRASNAVTDVFLSILPVVNVDFIFVYGAILFWVFVAALLLYEPKRIPFALKSIAVFTIIRSALVSLTHIGPSPEQILLSPNRVFDLFSFNGDLFFSAHTGIPFLFALIFWEHRWLRYLFLVLSGVFGSSVLLGHLHYSIDVFAAYFITYSIFHIARRLFPRDYIFFHNGIHVPDAA